MKIDPRVLEQRARLRQSRMVLRAGKWREQLIQKAVERAKREANKATAWQARAALAYNALKCLYTYITDRGPQTLTDLQAYGSSCGHSKTAINDGIREGVQDMWLKLLPGDPSGKQWRYAVDTGDWWLARQEALRVKASTPQEPAQKDSTVNEVVAATAQAVSEVVDAVAVKPPAPPTDFSLTFSKTSV